MPTIRPINETTTRPFNFPDLKYLSPNLPPIMAPGRAPLPAKI